ncbi:uncharacterized protein LOC124358982 isoform X2 [Homalodisca vitripennis]|uniref:uncharacterized protein LOC124358982 isoform X2 n=1 Tax=Homalodisca vitripennis TaxID=197043 RepID=UPI001EEAA870|nr:uncharacterized protein LOC124358982 isoform X2 [Homalodisca vitripennis]
MSVCTGVASPAEGLICFVCDGTVVGRYYTLASCKTQVTKQKLVEKLGHLVGEQYMVVISEDDIICRSCTTMMNNLDRLEKEMSSVRSVILRFLEKKYGLDEGELANSKVVLPPPPAHPDIVKPVKKTEPSLPTFHERKKQSAKAHNEQEAKSNVWMQCDRCKYTTPYSSFMINHIHKHSEPKKQEEKQNNAQVEAEDNERSATVKAAEEVPPPLPLEAEAEQAAVANTEAEVVENSQEVEEGIEPGVDVEGPDMDGAVVEMDMGEENICMVDENGIVLQKVQQSEDGQFYVVEGDIDGAKQMLSVAEDGSVQMVQVMWDDIVAGDDNMQF